MAALRPGVESIESRPLDASTLELDLSFSLAANPTRDLIRVPDRRPDGGPAANLDGSRPSFHST